MAPLAPPMATPLHINAITEATLLHFQKISLFPLFSLFSFFFGQKKFGFGSNGGWGLTPQTPPVATPLALPIIVHWCAFITVTAGLNWAYA